MDLCGWSARRPGARVSHRWWEQAGLYLEGAKKMATATSAELDREETVEEEEGMTLV